jgi:hypothetical protein
LESIGKVASGKGNHMATAAGAKTPAQTFALVFGAVYVLVGILGFVMDPILGIFEVNLLHNIAHLAVGGLFLFGSKSPAGAKQISLIIGVVYGLLAVLGFMDVLVVDLLDANLADDFLHLGTALVALYFGTAGGKVVATTTA